MTLNDFIARAVSFFDRAEKGADTAATMAEQVKALEGRLAAAQAKMDEMSAEVTKAAADLAAKDSEIARLTAAVDAEKAKVTNTLAAARVAPSAIPTAAPGGTEDILARYDAITDPAERTAFFREHRAAVFAAWKRTSN